MANTLPSSLSWAWASLCAQGSKSREDFAWPVVVREGRVNVLLGVPDFYPASEGNFALGMSSSSACEKSWAGSSESESDSTMDERQGVCSISRAKGAKMRLRHALPGCT